MFKNENKLKYLDAAKLMSEHYGIKILSNHVDLKNHPLGFDDGQQMFGFYYNTPDNSLPIFWCNLDGWIPAFRRYDKLYNREAMKYDESVFI
ncbi:MAG: hypothetical protein PHV32_11100 [Eubacteriales bacterium]|nr:hypothetical protein [Eubacteriales bacterium]